MVARVACVVIVGRGVVRQSRFSVEQLDGR